MVIEQLGSPALGLPPSEDMLTRPATIPAGERERAQELILRVFGTAREVLAITDGAFTAHSMQLLLEAPKNATIRILAWEQPLSDASRVFRTELEALRQKRTGSVSVAAPLETGPSSATLPSGCWVFVPGHAFHFSLPLMDAWMATAPVKFQPYEDAGNLYDEHFGRWWDGMVPGYQTLYVQRQYDTSKRQP
jgi:hypothetical protein